jgi:hypothetical protein
LNRAGPFSATIGNIALVLACAYYLPKAPGLLGVALEPQKFNLRGFKRFFSASTARNRTGVLRATQRRYAARYPGAVQAALIDQQSIAAIDR